MSGLPAKIGRARLQLTPAGLRVIIPAFWQDRFFLRVIFRPIALVFAVWCLWRLYPDSMIFMVFNAMLVAIVATQLAWRFLGREIVTVNKTTLTLRGEIAGFGWTRSYALPWVSGLKFGEVHVGRKPSGFGFLYFDYDSKRPSTEMMVSVMFAFWLRSFTPRSPRFAKGLTEVEGRALIQVIVEYAGATLRVEQPRAAAGGKPALAE